MLKKSITSKLVKVIGMVRFAFALLMVGVIAVLSQTASAQTIRQVRVEVHTANINNAGTDDPTYISFGGREFRLDNPQDNCERNYTDLFIYGRGANVTNQHGNNPQSLTKANVEQFPIYIRKGPDGSNGGWAIGWVTVKFTYSDTSTRTYSRSFSPPVWLEEARGLTVYIKE